MFGRAAVPAEGSAPRQSESDQSHEASTRDRVLAMVSESGPITASSLAESLGVTATGIRRHLDGLLEQGLITASDHATAVRGRGRPARAYVLTAAGHARMDTAYDEVATAALRYLAEAIGPDAVTEFAQRRVAELEDRYAAAVAAAGPVLTDRVHALANALARDGFAASTRPVAGVPTATGTGTAGAMTLTPSSAQGVQLCQGHCPMHQVAAQFPQFCEVETEAFARLLGVHVQRLSTLAAGGHVCTTYVPQPALAISVAAPHEGTKSP